MKNVLALIVVTALATLSFVGSGCDTAGGATDISQKEVVALAGSEARGALIVDVRSPGEYAAGHVPGATNIPHDQISGRLDELPEDRSREIVLYCKSGYRAGKAASTLSAAGFSNLRHLAGDMSGWTAAGLPEEK